MRNIININKGWEFSKPEQEKVLVNIPHTWNAEDGMDGGADYFRGTCHYTKTIKRSELPEADCYYLEINGAASSADVYVNGKAMAHHDGGYSTWRVDLTEELSDEILLDVAVDNEENDKVYPQVADFTFYGGIYRDVNIIAVSKSHFDLDYFGGKGLTITPVLKGENAKVEVQTYITNKAEGQELHVVLKNAEGVEVAEGTTANDALELEIKNVHRWHGRKDPYLYTCEVELLEEGKVIDSVSSRFGCRTFEIDSENGFILNGEEYPLRGVSRHQDRIGFGNALLKEHHDEDMDLICEVGATTIRLAHYQHDQYFYDLCDEKGMVVWAEIPYISSHMATGRENTISQMKELVVQNYNHPSIVVWGLSNEISIGGSDEDLLENHNILNDMCHEMDPTRLTTIEGWL